jgi:hypothetical protein
MADKELIRAAELRTVVKDISAYKTALNTFKLKYGSNIVPGDMADASSYWLGAIDGNGDGIVECTTGVLEEAVAFW